MRNKFNIIDWIRTSIVKYEDSFGVITLYTLAAVTAAISLLTSSFPDAQTPYFRAMSLASSAVFLGMAFLWYKYPRTINFLLAVVLWTITISHISFSPGDQPGQMAGVITAWFATALIAKAPRLGVFFSTVGIVAAILGPESDWMSVSFFVGSLVGLFLSIYREAKEEYLEVLGKLTYRIKHNYQTDLESVVRTIDMLKDTEPDKRRQQQLASIARIMENSLDELEDYSSYSRGALAIAKSNEINIRTELSKFATLYEFDLSAPDAVVRLDAEVLSTTLRVLLSNANKYKRQSIRLSAELKGNFLSVTVTDDGAGIPKKTRPEIFNKGVSDPTKKETSGFGLWDLKTMLTAHGGNISFATQTEADSAKDSFTSFTAVLPVTTVAGSPIS